MTLDAKKFIHSKWLKSIDIEDDAPVDVTIKDVKTGYYTDKEQEERIFLHFREFSKPFGCGNAVVKALIELLGRDAEKWVGATITLTVVDVEAFGEKVQAIRVADQLPDTKPKRRRRPPADEDDDDDRPRRRRPKRAKRARPVDED